MTAVTTATSARQRIMVAAERLIAEQGPAASLREIAAEAGQRNTSAVHYHFGSRDALIESIVELRQDALEHERLARLASSEDDTRATLRDLVEVLVGPMFTEPYAEGSTHYARFLEKVRDHPALTGPGLAAREWPATKLIIGRMAARLDALPRARFQSRMRALTTTMFALLADAERASESSRVGNVADRDEVVAMLLGMLTAGLD